MLHAEADLVIEIHSPGAENEHRDREAKLKLYSRQGVREYWNVDYEQKSVQVFRRENAVLVLAATLLPDDDLTSQWLPDFSIRVAEIFRLPPVEI